MCLFLEDRKYKKNHDGILLLSSLFHPKQHYTKSIFYNKACKGFIVVSLSPYFFWLCLNCSHFEMINTGSRFWAFYERWWSSTLLRKSIKIWTYIQSNSVQSSSVHMMWVLKVKHLVCLNIEVSHRNSQSITCSILLLIKLRNAFL